MGPPSEASSFRNPAILLLGPTGAGKSPLGDLIERRSHQGKRWLHFDFGAALRDVVAGPHVSEQQTRAGCRPTTAGDFSSNEIAFLRAVLSSGALLEDEHFPIACRILRSFMIRRAAKPDTWIVLNGIPRHAGQAQAIEEVLDVQRVVHLRCSEETVLRRLQSNVGGDRTARTDDDSRSVATKLAIFDRRTIPLLEHFERRGATLDTVEVSAEMTAEQMWAALTRA